MPIAGWGFAPALAAGNTRRPQAGRAHPAHRAPARRARARGRPPRGRLQVLPGKGSVVGERFVTHPRVRKIVFTGSTEVGQRVMARLRRAGQAGDARARRQERQHRLRRRRPRAGRGHRAVRRLRQRRPGLLRAVADPGAAHRSTTGSWSCSSRPCAGVRVERPAADTAEMGPLISRGQRETVASYVPDDAPVAFRGTAPDGPGFWFPPTVLAPGRRDRPHGRARRSSARWSSCCRSTTRPTRSGSPTTPPYGLSGSIWTRDLGRALRVARAVETGNLSVNSPLVGALLDAVRRVQAVRARPRARPGRARRVHRDQERLHRPPTT